MTAEEARRISNENTYREDAVRYGIEEMNKKIERVVLEGRRDCMADFYNFPCGYKDFEKKYGKENRGEYKRYNIETEIREYFTKNGFLFKYITDDVCGGVKQDPYWKICW